MTSGFISYVDELRALLAGAKGTWRGEEMPVAAAMDVWVTETHRAAETDRRFFFIGNGASATMAEHFGFDAMQNGGLKTVNFAESAYLTALSNDLSFADVFSLKLERLAEPGDVLVSISSSGNSPNVVRALEQAGTLGLRRVTLSAMKADNKSRALGDLSIWVPAKTYGMAESAHSAILHCWLDLYLEKYKGRRH
jgi:D-sedoheptulose 7-phosphate isomerase